MSTEIGEVHVAHFVHQNDDGQILVIAQPFNIGNENDLFKNLFEDLPNNAEKNHLRSI